MCTPRILQRIQSCFGGGAADATATDASSSAISNTSAKSHSENKRKKEKIIKRSNAFKTAKNRKLNDARGTKVKIKVNRKRVNGWHVLRPVRTWCKRIVLRLLKWSVRVGDREKLIYVSGFFFLEYFCDGGRSCKGTHRPASGHVDEKWFHLCLCAPGFWVSSVSGAHWIGSSNASAHQ